MADNSCHFGLNNFFADNGLDDGYATQLYFPADGEQMEAVVRRIFSDKGVLSTSMSILSSVMWPTEASAFPKTRIVHVLYVMPHCTPY